MSRFTCHCGQSIKIIEIPSPYLYHIYSDDVFVNSDDLGGIVGRSSEVVRCPRCDRLYVWWFGTNGEVTEYVPAPLCDERADNRPG